jgi:hypothetical protein
LRKKKTFLSKLDSISTFILSENEKDLKPVIDRHQKKLKEIKLHLGMKPIVISNRSEVNIIEINEWIPLFNELALKCSNIEVLKIRTL